MSVRIKLRGTVRADGTLELDSKIAMPEGRVLVTLQPAIQPGPDDPFWSLMGRIWDGHGRHRLSSEAKPRTDTSIKPVSSDLDREF